MTTENHYDTIVIGGGIAGLTAGLYLPRAEQKTLILEGEPISNTELPGGQLTLTPHLDNFPGFVGAGYDLIELVRNQAENLGSLIEMEQAVEFDLNPNGKHSVTTSEGTTYTATSVIIATGAIARRLGIPGEDDYFGRGVSSCATCDGAFFKNKVVAVVGGGDTAVEEALYLADVASEVILIHRRDELRTDSPESRSLFKKENVRVIWNSSPDSVSGDTHLRKVHLANNVTGEKSDLNLDGLFIAIGNDPAVKCFHGTPIEVAGNGYLAVNDTRTNIPGVFGAGDVADSVYRQAITAAATGAQAAMNAIKFNKSQSD